MMRQIWQLLLIPSTYGMLVWVFLMSLLALGATQVDVSWDAILVYLYVIVCFFVSNSLLKGQFDRTPLDQIGRKIVCDNLDVYIFGASTVVGFFGLFLYIYDFSTNLGGVIGFFETFITDPLKIRSMAVETTSLGFQISYFSWLSVFYCVLMLAVGWARSWSVRALLGSLGVLQFALNLLFIDRTRPTTLFVMCSLGFVAARFWRIKRPLRFFSAVFLSPLVIFFAQALYTGKYNAQAGLFSNFMVYVFGGFGYLSSLLTDVIPDYSLERTFYPIAKMLEFAGFVRSVPPQILSFRGVPFLTNAGTFLEPLASDGGVLLLIVGIPVIIYLIDLMALWAVRTRSIPGLFLWSNLVLVVLFSFFVPKYNATYLYLFAAISAGAGLVRPRVNSQVVE